MKRRRRTRRGERGQSMVELAFLSPLILFFLLGVGDMGYSLYQAQLATSLAREGSNLTARYATLDATETVLRKIASRPVSFDDDGTVILSVVKLGADGANKDVPIISQRLRIGDLKEPSVLGNPADTSYDVDADRRALKPDTDTSIRASLPNGLTIDPGQTVYVTEVYQNRRALVRREMFGWALPATIGASAFF
jgi:hypothetical protein